MIRLILPVGLISAAILAYEVLLIRLFAIVQWHLFAYMAISIALLGFGASGSFLFLARGWLRSRFTAAFAVNAVLFAVTGPAAFMLGQQVPFNALALLWEPRQLLYLGLLYLLFAVPFFAGANCIGLALTGHSQRIAGIYAANLIGAGLGALGAVALLFVMAPNDALRPVAGLALAAAALSCLGPGRRTWALLLWAAAFALPIGLPAAWTELHLSPYKNLSASLAVKDRRIIGRHSSPLGLLTVVESPTVPFRHAPGLSLNATAEPPAQLAVFTDGGGMTAITAFTGDVAELAYLDDTTGALAYQLLERPSVLVLGAGGGADVLQAIRHRARTIDAVELNGQLAALVTKVHADIAGPLYDRPGVRLHIAEARAYVARSWRSFDLIKLPLVESAGAAAAGVHALAENYLYTVEAFRHYLHRLRPGGMLSITRWLKLPPRDSLKLFATARAALEREAVAVPGRRLLLLRGWNTTTLLVKNGDFSAAEIARANRFAAARSFDLAYHPGQMRGTANRFNILASAYFFDGARALLRDDDFHARYKFDLTPATDDKPYFFDFFKWRSLPEFLRLRRQGGGQMLEMGYPVLAATLAQAVLLSLLLILLPLRFAGTVQRSAKSGQARVLGYFAALGLGFLMIEIAFIQRFILFLGHPLYAAAVVLCGFLVFAGLGSAAAPGISERFGRRIDPIRLAVAAVAILAVIYSSLLPLLFPLLMGLPGAAKIALTLIIIAPLAFCMGLPFPLGLTRVAQRLPDLVPWAWGINGCFSVISALLAAILAIHLGFAIVIFLAALIYLAAGAVRLAPEAEQTGGTRHHRPSLT